MAVLTVPARLPDETALRPRECAHSLPVGHPRPSDIRLDAEFALDPVHYDVQVQFTHARYDGLPGLIVVIDLESRVFVRKTYQRI